MMYVCSFMRFTALLMVSLSLISCQKKLDLEAGLPQASGIYVSESSGFTGVVMVSLPGGGLCSGTIVSHKAVLTAAHCTKRSGTYLVRGNFSSTAGNYFDSQKSTSVAVSYGPGEVEDPNDIAVLIFPDHTFEASDVIEIADSSSKGDIATLVGYGCSNLDTKTGSGRKRMGTNVIAAIDEYLEFYTPVSSTSQNARVRGIIGSSNRAGSCFGDSGGPALAKSGESYKLIAVTHAGGIIDSTIVSQYVDVSNRSDNRAFIAEVNKNYRLDIAGF